MDQFHVTGGRPLEGQVRISGAKNAVLPLLAASLLTDEEVVLHNVPNLRDVQTQVQILSELGAEAVSDPKTHRLRTRVVDPSRSTASYELVSTMRASFAVLGPLVARRGRARVSLPGGCVIGVRPVDLHLRGLAALGARIEIEGGYVVATAERLRGAEVYLGGSFGSSVLATANVLMAAVLAEGETVIECAAMEPEIEDLGLALCKMGARIEGVGTHRLRVRGVDRLAGLDHAVIPDRIEAGTFLIGAAMTRGDVLAIGARVDHLAAVLERLRSVGAEVTRVAEGVRVRGPEKVRCLDVTTLPYPGFPTDLQAQMMALATQAEGISLITEKIYPDRFIHVAELNRMGAQIRKEGAQAIVTGGVELSGAPVMASDLRASAALVLAGLVARGETEVHRVYHIDRGYETIDAKLQALGAAVRRVSETE
ncbi:MAG: UDP-N-acetylglucosamine 1-carboxyvinyltransferase [Planctomycetota bacterium]